MYVSKLNLVAMCEILIADTHFRSTFSGDDHQNVDFIYIYRTSFLKKFPKMHLPINASAATLSFGLALPVAIALFPQISQVFKR